MTVPSLSVALPVLNGASFIAGAVESVLSQTYGDYELVVSENCSTDGTAAIIADMTAGDPRVRLSQPRHPLRQGDNVNRAVRACRGDWVKILCHDDLLEPECLERLVEVTGSLRTRVALVGHAERWLFANGYLHDDRPHTGILTHHDGRSLLRDQLSGSASAPLPALTTALVRREAWASTDGFDPRYHHFDVYLWSRMMLDWDYAYLDTPLTVNRIHGAQVAVEARSSLESAFENQAFWREFVDLHGRSLSLSRSARLRNSLRGPSTAAAALAVELLKHEPRQAMSLARRLPVTWWPFIPILTARAYVREKSRTQGLREDVPVSDVYP